MLAGVLSLLTPWRYSWLAFTIFVKAWLLKENEMFLTIGKSQMTRRLFCTWSWCNILWGRHHWRKKFAHKRWSKSFGSALPSYHPRDQYLCLLDLRPNLCQESINWCLMSYSSPSWGKMINVRTSDRLDNFLSYMSAVFNAISVRNGRWFVDKWNLVQPKEVSLQFFA